jgi:excisionase family DNA binding protein
VVRVHHPKNFVQKSDSGLLYVGGFFARQILTIAHCLACEREARDLDSANPRCLAGCGTGPERRPHAPRDSPATEPDGHPDHLSAADGLPRTPSAGERKERPEPVQRPNDHGADFPWNRIGLRPQFKDFRSVIEFPGARKETRRLAIPVRTSRRKQAHLTKKKGRHMSSFLASQKLGAATLSTPVRDELPLTVRAAASFLGVSPQTVYLWVERKQIPHLRVMGRNIRFLKSDLEPFRATFKQEVGYGTTE